MIKKLKKFAIFFRKNRKQIEPHRRVFQKESSAVAFLVSFKNERSDARPL